MSVTLQALLLTRPEAAAQDFLKNLALEKLGEVILSPLLVIESKAEVRVFEAAIFTSRTGVAYAKDGQDRPAYCVGEKTADRAQKAGYVIEVVADNAKELVSQIVSNPPKTPLTHLRGQYSRGDVCRDLNRQGVQCSEQVLYTQNALGLNLAARELLVSKKPVIVPLFSPRTAEIFTRELTSLALTDEHLDCLQTVCLSEDIAKKLPFRLRKKTVVPQRPTRDMMLQSVTRCYSK